MKKYFFIFSIIVLASDVAYSFNYDECRRTFISPKPNNLYSVSSSITYTADLTTIPTDGVSSSVQFFSSTGGCRGIDIRDRRKLEYIASNFEQLKIDTARGNGEYIKGLSVLYKCDEKIESDFINVLQRNFKIIYLNRSPYHDDKYNTPSQAYTAINKVISSAKELNDCQVYF